MPNMLGDDELLAAIDIGSNSFHLAIARMDHGDLKKIAAMSEKVQLGAGLDEQKRLSEDVQKRGLDCLARFVGRLENVQAERLRVVATNALRQAVNADEFIARANAILPRPIEIISGREEARLIYVGVANTLVNDTKRFVVDIGGGSTELIVGKGHESILTESAQMGAVSFTQKFFKDGVISNAAFDAAISAAQKEIIPYAQRYQKTGFETVIGSSGTIKAVKGALMQLGLADKERITLDGVLALRQHLVGVGCVNDIELNTVKAHRKAIFPAGLAVLIAVMQIFGVKRMTYSDGALREGVMYDMMSRLGSDDVRDLSTQALIERFNVDKKQAKRVVKTARMLFNDAKAALNLSDADNDLLRRVAFLHEIGLAIGHSGYHRHSAYMLENAEIAGFSRMDQAQMAQMVRHHRRKLHAADFERICRVGGERLARLTLLLRLAVAANHSRNDLARHQIHLTIKSVNDWQILLEKDSHGGHALLLSDLKDEAMQLIKWGVNLQVSVN
ncbi:exopolyphosphatase [Moraxella caviae]|uniref:Exopolyphosphatase n=1 Tax=Moraxella caviae TaxID=34060 RepID=A0A1T0AB10_9GAMM|nr:Ppx/GppA phosphatase family protein [Moraxella caviae]OOR92893.1 exopolyphosphatase [Moraxella caviae]STZ10367.1 Exopolyphosphatase [Moraxella caviae]VEW12590.1 Exopolyphosphatase [Moraxella caviae]